MPIRPEERARYPKDWPAISRRIREREGQRCKWCSAPNGREIVRLKSDPSRWYAWPLPDPQTRHDSGTWSAPVTVVLTVAHLDHTPENCDDDNLAALCQRCHLTYDAKHHAATARRTRDRKRGQGSLF